MQKPSKRFKLEINKMEDKAAAQATTGVTSLKMPVIVEAALANLCAIASLIFFAFEKENLYVRAHALHSIFFFVVCAIIGFPFFLFCVILGGAMEGIYIALIVIYCVLRIVLIVLACVFAKSERFLTLPILSSFILKLAN
ncbi:hypothetical protein EIN_399980 [Entamoeba invadens IP1]|uniref:Uncharacterized protein n=1 Tax=Entamoeba invadens IP1 TaxID=370355 RepID=A0A0A1UA64_ENTIV|nr:hypothetical protein EIN_399980 [Entamoeba invadens IP1]ELP91938.1 hypothetical protein EIN_399980 [Entamoeba invadens IP1]|eukprot:XP_004258709.1 hypothetical protein EIN_399980 [Entamoeba invadens IP1]